jgi:ubiquinone/menaquinone biosynthesis C-methylase UbiE
MPSYASLSTAELDDLVAYLRTLRAIPPVEERERTRAIGGLSENVAFFNRPGRDAEERSDAIVEALEIPAGATVADVGAGTGYFTWRLAQRAGAKGQVLAVDVQQKMLDLTAEAVRQHGLTNVVYVLGTDANPRLPDNALDLVFIAYSYHEFSQPETTMAAIARALKPGGRVFILEFAKESRSAPASATHKMSLEEIRSEIEPLGFELDQMLDFLPMQHGLVYRLRR